MFIFIFILIIGLLVFVHELGHFVAAKRAGAKVEEFGLGYPPRIWKIKRGDTIYSINLLPFGGFVKIYGMEGEDNGGRDSFNSKSVFQRAKIIIAGVLMNLVLAFILLVVGYTIGLPVAVNGDDALIADVQIAQVVPNSPAAMAGIRMGDMVREFKATNFQDSISNVKELQNDIAKFKGSEVELLIQRGDKLLTFLVVPRENYPVNEGAVGVGLANIVITSYPWYEAIVRAVASVISMVGGIVFAISNLIFGLFVHTQAVVSNVAGPVGIFILSEEFYKLGFVYLLQLIIILSINLAILNLLPFPALDGGHLFFLLIEKIKGSPIKKETERMINSIGFSFLILIMVIVTVKDVISLF